MSKQPKYVEIYTSLKNGIVNGHYPMGSLLPTEAMLMGSYSASRTTVRKALSMLAEDKLVEARQGRGTTVIGEAKTVSAYKYLSVDNTSVVSIEFQDSVEETSSQKAAIDIIEAPGEAAKALELTSGSKVYRLQRIKLVDDEIFSYVTSYIPVELCPGLEAHNGEILFLYKFLSESYGLKLETTRDLMTAEAADFIQSRILGIPINAPVLKSRRTAYTSGKPFEYSESLLVGSKVKLVIASKMSDLGGILGE